MKRAARSRRSFFALLRARSSAHCPGVVILKERDASRRVRPPVQARQNNRGFGKLFRFSPFESFPILGIPESVMAPGLRGVFVWLPLVTGGIRNGKPEATSAIRSHPCSRPVNSGLLGCRGYEITARWAPARQDALTDH
jgi:hypothetical protein